MVTRKKSVSKSTESQKRSKASKKGWLTRRQSDSKKKLSTKTTRGLSSEKLKKLQRQEKIRNISRRKAQKKGRSLVTDKPKLKSKKPIRLARKASKKRVSIR